VDGLCPPGIGTMVLVMSIIINAKLAKEARSVS
jgi:hypothetical protein